MISFWMIIAGMVGLVIYGAMLMLMVVRPAHAMIVDVAGRRKKEAWEPGMHWLLFFFLAKVREVSLTPRTTPLTGEVQMMEGIPANPELLVLWELVPEVKCTKGRDLDTPLFASIGVDVFERQIRETVAEAARRASGITPTLLAFLNPAAYTDLLEASEIVGDLLRQIGVRVVNIAVPKLGLDPETLKSLAEKFQGTQRAAAAQIAVELAERIRKDPAAYMAAVGTIMGHDAGVQPAAPIVVGGNAGQGIGGLLGSLAAVSKMFPSSTSGSTEGGVP